MHALIPQILDEFKAAYGLKVTDRADTFLVMCPPMTFLHT